MRRTAAAVFSHPSGALTLGGPGLNSTRTLEKKSTGQVTEKGISPKTPWARTPQTPGARAVAAPIIGWDKSVSRLLAVKVCSPVASVR